MTINDFLNIFDHPLQQWPMDGKRRKDRNTKVWISAEWKELFRWNKKHFSESFEAYHLVKKWKIVDTNFKVVVDSLLLCMYKTMCQLKDPRCYPIEDWLCGVLEISDTENSDCQFVCWFCSVYHWPIILKFLQ